jgi:folate-binding protein YgfZ
MACKALPLAPAAGGMLSPMEGVSVADLPLGQLHEDLGASWKVEGGHPVAERYGSLAGEHRALVEGRAFAHRSFVDLVMLTGTDRVRFLHGQVTCDVKALAAGHSAYGFFTSVQGRVLSELVVLALPDRLLLELPAGRGAAMAEHLRRYVIADDVEIAVDADQLPLTLFGTGAEEAVGLPQAAPEAWTCEGALLFDLPVLADRRPLWGMPSLTLWTHAEHAAACFQRIVEAGRCVGLTPVGLAALDARRVELGVPRFGRDFGADHFPQETGLDAQAVSYTKGCYLGQEVVARIHYRGQVNRVMRGLRLPGESLAAESLPDGTEVSFEGRPLGVLSSATMSPALGGAIALAVVHRRGGDAGTRVGLPDGGAAEVVELPFV